MELDSYEINIDTLAIIPYGKKTSKVYEGKDIYIVHQSSYNIIKNSCLYYGCSYDGRREGSKFLIGSDMKIPIVIEERHNIIFFPTSSCIRENSIWISFQNLVKYNKYNDISSMLYFKNHVHLVIGCKYNLIDSQFIRCIKLENAICKRNNFDRENIIYSI